MGWGRTKCERLLMPPMNSGENPMQPRSATPQPSHASGHCLVPAAATSDSQSSPAPANRKPLIAATPRWPDNPLLKAVWVLALAVLAAARSLPCSAAKPAAAVVIDRTWWS